MCKHSFERLLFSVAPVKCLAVRRSDIFNCTGDAKDLQKIVIGPIGQAKFDCIIDMMTIIVRRNVDICQCNGSFHQQLNPMFQVQLNLFTNSC